VAIYGGADLPPGANELSLGDLSRQIESSRRGATAILGDVRNLAFAYHYRWAFSCAPLVVPAYAGAWLANAIVILIAASVAMIHPAVSGRPEGLHYT
jgi:hypothetical protein